MEKSGKKAIWIIILFAVILIFLSWVISLPPPPRNHILVNFKTNCEIRARINCLSLGVLPIGWAIPVPVNEGGRQRIISCYNVTGSQQKNLSCAAYGYAVPRESG